jgi:hypothetical protein
VDKWTSKTKQIRTLALNSMKKSANWESLKAKLSTNKDVSNNNSNKNKRKRNEIAEAITRYLLILPS